MSVQHKLKKVKYQLLKNSTANPAKSWTDEELVDNVRDIYDTLINEAGDVSGVDVADLPSEVLGATIEWSPDLQTITITKGAAATSPDDLTDDVEEPVYDSTKFFETTSGDLFTVEQTGDYFEFSI